MAALPPLILASTSPYRAAQLRRLGLEFSIEDPGVDEGDFKRRGGLKPQELVAALAIAKARAVALEYPEAVVIGGDQAVFLGTRIFDKPRTSAAAVQQLLALSGRTHTLLTAIAIVRGDRVQAHASAARMTLRKLAQAEIERYVAADQPLDCAGSYKFEARGIALFERVELDDPSAIEGLPLLALCGLLRGHGFELP